MLNHLLFDLVAAHSGWIVPVSSIAHRQPRGINSDPAKNEDAGRRLWALSEELLGITFDMS
jgi:hypothetical protein